MSQPESRLSRQIMEAMRARGAFVFKVHGGPLTMAGVPDICGVYRGVSIWLETKTPTGGGPSAIQQHRHMQIREAGGTVIVPRSVDDAMALLDAIDAD